MWIVDWEIVMYTSIGSFIGSILCDIVRRRVCVIVNMIR